jgi:hypothetical protein
MMMTEPLCLGVCELYNPVVHGACDPPVSDYFFYTCQVDLSEFYDNSIFSYISEYRSGHKYTGVVRSYWNIVHSRRGSMYPMLEIVQPVTMEPGGECVAVLKTFWIRIVQRRWKRIFAERRKHLAQLLKPYGLLKRECGWKL